MTKKNNLFYFIFASIFLVCCNQEYQHQFIIHSQGVQPVNQSVVKIKSIMIDRPSEEIVSFGYCWSVNPSPTIYNDSTMGLGNLSKNEFEDSLASLSLNKEYYVRAYLIDRLNNVYYGNEIKFLNNYFPSFTNTRLNGITDSYFEIFSELELNGKEPIIKFGHVWSTNRSPSLDDESSNITEFNVEQNMFSYVSQLTGLAKSTKYYIKPYIIEKWGIVYGSEIAITVPEKIVTGQWKELLIPDTRIQPFYYCTLQNENSLYFFTGNDGEYNAEDQPNLDFFLDEFSNDCEKLDMLTNEVSDVATFPGQLRFYTHGFFINGLAYVGFGFNDYDPMSGMFDMWEYSPATNSWRSRKKIPSSGETVILCAANGGSGYVLVKKSTKLELWRYNPVLDSWQKISASIPTVGDVPVSNGIISNGNFLYFSAGESTIEYNIVNNSWRKISDFMTYLFFIYKDNIYAIKADYSVLKWDETNNIWIQKVSLPIDRRGISSSYKNLWVEDVLVSVNMNGEPIIGVYIAPGYLETVYDQSVWFKYSEK